eukprot:TRINITY_DN11294_c0_g2_i1.p1 TRINITY_DN11294_c0_g2~~TRINITY_DN11294_c0_g2_i1.p1  ORF type:complete len:350 (+),score=60.90 TRINITY_DN11294_c0_g2_i1:49-1050(+)
MCIRDSREREEHVISKTKHFEQIGDEHRFIAALQARGKTISHKALSQVIGYSSFQEEGMCGSQHIFNLYFQAFQYDLQIEIEDRRRLRDPFKEKDLWTILSVVSEVCDYLRQSDIAHGNLCPRNIFVETRKREFILIDPIVLDDAKTVHQNALFGTKITFISPAQMKSVQNREFEPKHDKFKSDVFSMGMTLLEAATLKSAADCYNMSIPLISRQAIDKMLTECRSRYSQTLVDTIATMLEMDESRRPYFNPREVGFLTHTFKNWQPQPQAPEPESLAGAQTPGGRVREENPTGNVAQVDGNNRPPNRLVTPPPPPPPPVSYTHLTLPTIYSV